jgi:hypothetical protein
MRNIARSFVVVAVGLTTVLAVPSALAAPGGPVPEVLPAPPPGQGQIVFWRPGSLAGATLGCGVNIGTERISALGRGKYFLLNLEPGAYEFNAKSEAKDTLNLEVEQGEVYFVKCTIRMGIMVGRPNLAPSNLGEFAAKKGDLKYVDSDDIGPRVLPDPSTSVAPTVTEQPTSSETEVSDS